MYTLKFGRLDDRAIVLGVMAFTITASNPSIGAEAAAILRGISEAMGEELTARGAGGESPAAQEERMN